MFISGPTKTFLLSLLNDLVSEAMQGGKDTPELVPCWGEREEARVPQPRGPLPLEHNVAGLVDCSDIVSVALLLSIDTLPHGGLADDVQSAVGHLCVEIVGGILREILDILLSKHYNWKNIEFLTIFCQWLQNAVTEFMTMCVHHIKEVLQDPKRILNFKTKYLQS